MLYDVHKNREVKSNSHDGDYHRSCARMTAAQIQGVKDAINRIVDQRIAEGKPLITSSWLPGSDWSNTPFDPIWRYGAQQDEMHAKLLYGMFVWHTMKERPDYWSFGRYPKKDEIIGLTYFQVQPH